MNFLPGTPSVLFFLGNFTPKTSNYYGLKIGHLAFQLGDDVNQLFVSTPNLLEMIAFDVRIFFKTGGSTTNTSPLPFRIDSYSRLIRIDGPNPRMSDEDFMGIPLLN